MAKRISDQERLEYVKKYKTSGLSVSEFAKRHNLARCTLRDWINAFESISGDFIQVSPSLAEKGFIERVGANKNEYWKVIRYQLLVLWLMNM